MEMWYCESHETISSQWCTFARRWEHSLWPTEVLQAHPVGGGPRSDAAGLGMSQCLPRRAEGGAEEEVVRNKWLRP